MRYFQEAHFFPLNHNAHFYASVKFSLDNLKVIDMLVDASKCHLTKFFILGTTIEKICKKLKYSNNGFLSYQQDTANPAHLLLPYFDLPSKSHCSIPIFCVYMKYLYQIGMEKVFKRYK